MHRSFSRTGTLLAVLAGGIAFSSARAATYTVTNLDETGDGSLRAAVDAANSAGGSNDIVFQSGLSGTISYEEESGNGEVQPHRYKP